MSNKEAAEILKYLFPPVTRGDGTTMTKLLIVEALSKAIKVLENTPESNPKD